MNTTQLRYQRRHMADLAAGLRLSRAQLSREHQPRAELVRHQQHRLEVVVRHAAAHSPFYRRQFAQTGALGDGPVQLSRLPVLDKPLLMEHFDELVCDPRLRRDELLEWVGRITRDQLYLNRYRVMLTSGSSGRPSLYVYDAAGWGSVFAGMLRSTAWEGLRPTLPRQRMAFVGAADPSHISSAREPPWRVACTASWPCPSRCRCLGSWRRSTSFNPPISRSIRPRPCGWSTSSAADGCGYRHGSWSPPRSCALPR